MYGRVLGCDDRQDCGVGDQTDHRLCIRFNIFMVFIIIGATTLVVRCCWETWIRPEPDELTDDREGADVGV